MNTLKDLAEHCYQQWLSKDQTDLPSGAIKWIRDSLGEAGMAMQIDEIFSAAIKPSEKCYRFLKLTGVIERERIIKLLRKQILDELEAEREQSLLEVDEQWRARVDEQRQKIFNKHDDTSFSFFWFVVFVAIIGGFIGAIVGRVSDSVSVDLGWRVGVLIGATVAYGYRKTRASTLTEQFINSASGGTESQKRGIEESIRDRKANLDSDIRQLLQTFSLPLMASSVDPKSSNVYRSKIPVGGKNSLKYRYAGVIASLGLLSIISPSYLFPISGRSPELVPAPTQASTNSMDSGQFDQMISKRLDEIGNEIKRGNYKLASLKMDELERAYPNLADQLSHATKSWVFAYKAKIYQHTGNLKQDTFMLEGTVTEKSEMQGSGTFWGFGLQDEQGQKYDFFSCSSTSAIYFDIDDNKIDFLDGYNKLKNAYSKVRVYIRNSDKVYFDKCKNTGCDGGICPAAIVMLSK